MIIQRHIKKIVLIQPPVQDFYDTDIRLQPIGLCYLKAALKKHHPNLVVKILDFHHGWGRKTIPLPRDLAYLKKYYFIPDTGPFRTFDQYFHFGASFEAIGDLVSAEQPDLVGISSLFSPYYREVLACAKEIRQHCDALVVVGGSHVSCHPDSILSSPWVDFVVLGEGERPLTELVGALRAGHDLTKVPNLGYRENVSLRYTPTADNFPMNDLSVPDFSDLQPDRYLYEGRPICMIMTSRGCPHQCAFCSVRCTFGRCYRSRPPLDIVREIEERYLAGWRVFDFEDDNLTFNQEQFGALCDLIAERFAGREIQLLAMNGVSYKSLDEETLIKMRRAGFTNLNLALVSASEQTLKAVRRRHGVEDFSGVVAKGIEFGFDIVAYQILGLPSETLDDMINTLVFLARHPVLIGVSTFYLTPGSSIAVDLPPLTEEDIFRSRSTAMAVETGKFKRDQLYTLFITARILNFLKGLSLPDGEEFKIQNIIKGKESFESRSHSGLYLLHRLLSEKHLYANTRRGPLLIKRFESTLFSRLWQQLDYLRTQENKMIFLS